MRLLSVVVVLAVCLATYAAGVSYTGQQSEQLLQQELTRLERKAPVPVSLSLDGQRGFFSSQYRLELEFHEAGAEFQQLLGGNSLPLRVQVDNGFFTSSTRIQLASGPLLQRLKSWQQQPESEPLLLLLRQRLDPFKQQFEQDIQLQTDSFQSQHGPLEVSFGPFSLDARMEPGRYSSRADLAQIQIRQENQKLSLDGLSVEQNIRLKPGTDLYAGLYDQADIRLEMAPFLMEGKRSRIQVQSMQWQLSQYPEVDRVLLDSKGRIGFSRLENRAGGNPVNLNEVRLDTRLSLGREAIDNLALQLSQLTPLQAQNPLLLMPLLDGIFNQGIVLYLNQLHMQFQQGAMDATGRFELAAVGLDQLLAQPDQLERHLLLELDTVFDPAVLEEVSPDDSWQQQLETFKTQGFLQPQGARLGSRVMLSNGQLTINGIPVGVQ